MNTSVILDYRVSRTKRENLTMSEDVILIQERKLSSSVKSGEAESSTDRRDNEKPDEAKKWAYHFEALKRAVNNIYEVCSMQQSITGSKVSHH